MVGSMCLESLTNSNTDGGWKSDQSIISIIETVFLALSSKKPPARINRDGVGYDKNEAISAYRRVAGDHKWKIPSSLDRL
jgi:hypothetical protein